MLESEFAERPKDELELATSWNRAFITIYTRLRWLQGFSQINLIGIKKLIKRVRKYLHTRTDIEDHIAKISDFVLEKEFTHTDELELIKTNLVSFYAHTYTNSDLKKAENKLLSRSFQIRTSDLFTIAFFSGMIIALLIALVLLILIRGISVWFFGLFWSFFGFFWGFWGFLGF